MIYFFSSVFFSCFTFINFFAFFSFADKDYFLIVIQNPTE